MPSAPSGHTKTHAPNHNVQALPKTRCCSLCPAKFTRTTHLNRHLRSHTNERRHRCNICKSAQFTRSDLLSRHQQRCGQSVDLSRRRSCEACVASKVKCNRHRPCTRCAARGRSCIYRNDPELSRKMSCEASGAESDTQKSGCSPPNVQEDSRHCPPFTDNSPVKQCSPSPTFPDLPPHPQSAHFSKSVSLHSSPRSHDLQAFDGRQVQALDYLYDVGAHGDLFPSSSLTAPSLSPLQEANWLCLPPAVVDDRVVNVNEGGKIRDSDPPPGAPRAGDAIPVPLPPRNPNLLSRPILTFMSVGLFFTRFLAHVPLIHAPTWKMAETPTLLVRIFHACGALFVRTPSAAAFVEATLASATAEIDEEFSMISDTTSPEMGIPYHHIHLIVALVLLQTVYLFQRESAGRDRPLSTVTKHHTMLVAMIRRTRLIEHVGTWRAPDWTGPCFIENAWIEWVQFAIVKRALLLAYLHDCQHCMYLATPPAFSIAELDVHLPCDDELWNAPSAADWFNIAHTPSPYGIGMDRIYGVKMHLALATLATPAPPSAAPDAAAPPRTPAGPPLPPFALFLLIHTILRTIWGAGVQRGASSGGDGAEFTQRMQGVLDNWLRLWLLAPEATRESDSGEEIPPFVCNSLPFYWIAQLAVWEDSGAAPAAPMSENVRAEDVHYFNWNL
ncbi:fungal-specific transcription factor domain-containing protein [Mycena vitilis]|nr:fungal-specific transcription factor domain-containing protein [Mycena vitilis]